MRGRLIVNISGLKIRVKKEFNFLKRYFTSLM
jgi:hypothetical protein